jgi:hypothetical protein
MLHKTDICITLLPPKNIHEALSSKSQTQQQLSRNNQAAESITDLDVEGIGNKRKSRTEQNCAYLHFYRKWVHSSRKDFFQ